MMRTTKTADLDAVLQVLRALNDGDFAIQVRSGGEGIAGELAESVNALVERLNVVAGELTILCRELGNEGKLGGQVEFHGTLTWEDLEDNVNFMSAKLTDQLRSCVDVTTQLAEGNGSSRVTVACAGEMRELTAAINRVGDRLGDAA